MGLLHSKQYGGNNSLWNESIIEEAKNSGIVGMIRHSPSSSVQSSRNGLGLKGVIYNNLSTNGPIFSQLQMARELPSRTFSRIDFVSSLNKIPTSVYSSTIQEESGSSDADPIYHTDNEDSEPLCSICLEKYANGDEILTLACHHCFHSNCISKWFYKDFLTTFDPSGSFRCPQCRQDHILLSEKASSCCSVVADQGNVITPSSFVRVGKNILNEVGYDMLSDLASDDTSNPPLCEQSPNFRLNGTGFKSKLELSSYSDCGVPLRV